MCYSHTPYSNGLPLQKGAFARTRLIIAYWSVLICIAFIITDRGLSTPGLAEVAVIDNGAALPTPTNADLIDLPLDDYFNDTINPWQIFVTVRQWEAAHAQLRPCPAPNPTFTSALRRGQALAPDVYAGGLAFNASYNQLDSAFQIFAIFQGHRNPWSRVLWSA